MISKQGDIIKIKFRGVKTKFRILKEDDIITEDCYHQWLGTHHTLSYKEKIEHHFLNPKDLCKTECAGEYVYQHDNRIYMEKLT